MGDNLSRIKDALKDALSRAELVIISGGLGPTEDDITKEAVSEFLGRKLILDKGIFEKIKEKLSRYRVSEEAILRQSLVPSAAKTLLNPVGIAPGIIIEEKEKVIILLPGVPHELKAMLPQLRKYLSYKVKSNLVTKSSTLMV